MGFAHERKKKLQGLPLSCMPSLEGGSHGGGRLGKAMPCRNLYAAVLEPAFLFKQ
jgi:hypothetical protein